MVLWCAPGERVVLSVLGAALVVGMGLWAMPDRGAAVQVAPGPMPPTAGWDAALATARRINLNEATQQELERLPEVGPALARRIVEHRQRHGRFRSHEELLDVPGIGPKVLEAVRDYVTIE